MEFDLFDGVQKIFPSHGPDDESDDIDEHAKGYKIVIGLPCGLPDLFQIDPPDE